jgi:hypothetical protein
MTRIVTIVLTLLVGLASLFVSVCGGGFLVSLSYQALRQVFQPTGTNDALAVLPVMMFAAGCAAVGGWACWRCIQFIRRELSKRE